MIVQVPSQLRRSERSHGGHAHFPSRDSLRRLRFRPLDAVVGAGVFLLLYVVVRVGASARVPFHPSQATTIDTSPSRLPYYAARSLLRMFIALFFAYAFSFGYAYAAARSRRARRVLIPALDILQSVPVLGFLAVTVTFFLALFPGSELGLEAAAIFAVFTSQAWNITFSFYHSLVTQSAELDEASRLMGLSRWKRFWSVDVPGGAIGLVWNGMMSFGGSWFFLTASELIIVGGHRYTLPGVGSYVGVAVEQGRLGHVVWGIVTMIIMILVVNFVFWRPLVAYVERFRLEQTEASQKPRSVVLGRAAAVQLAGPGRAGQARHRPAGQPADGGGHRDRRPEPGQPRRPAARRRLRLRGGGRRSCSATACTACWPTSPPGSRAWASSGTRSVSAS